MGHQSHTSRAEILPQDHSQHHPPSCISGMMSTTCSESQSKSATTDLWLQQVLNRHCASPTQVSVKEAS